MKSTHASQKSRAIRFLWLLEVVIIVLAVLGSAWLRFLNDQETHLEFVEHAPARALLVAEYEHGEIDAARSTFQP